MSTREKLIKARRGLRALAEEVETISLACSPTTGGSMEDFYSLAFRKTFYQPLEQLQRDLDGYVEFYNRDRAHQGYRTQGRTPYQTSLDGIESMRKQEVKPEAAQTKIGCHRSRLAPAHLQLNAP